MTATATPPPPPTGSETRTGGEWIRDLINANVPDGDYTVSDIVAIVWDEALRNPELLNEWLWDMGRQVVRGEIAGIQRSRRSRFYSRQRAQAWARSAEEYHRTGDESVFSPFEIRYAVDENNTQRKVGDMTGADHMFVAARRQRAGDFDLLMANFHRRVAATVGGRRTAEVMTEDQYNRLYQILVGQELESPTE